MIPVFRTYLREIGATFWVLSFLVLPNASANAERVAGRVAIIGDSHTHGYFGEHLWSELKNSYRVSIFAAGGSNAFVWMNPWEAPWGYWEVRDNVVIQDVAWNANVKVPVPTLDRILTDLQPDAVVVALGTNHFWFIPQNEEMAFGSVKKAMLQIQNFKKSDGRSPQCIWIAPPAYAEKNQPGFGKEKLEIFYSRLMENANLCRIFTESRNYQATGLDGIHFHFPTGDYLAAQWAKKAASFIRGFLP